MTKPPPFPGFDGLMTLSRREGVDIRPTLLRVLTDLYVQASAHSDDEARQFVELTSRLIDEVDDATRAAVRARLAIYPGTPAEILKKLGVRPTQPDLFRWPRLLPPRRLLRPRSGRRPKPRCAWQRVFRCSPRTPPKSTTCSSAPMPASASRSCTASPIPR